MALGLTEEHAQLADSVRAWAQRHSPPAVARAAADGGTPGSDTPGSDTSGGRPDGGAAHYRDVLRPSLADQGLLGLHVSEADGGQGFGLPELAITVEELGRALVPGGFVPTALTAAVLVAAGLTGKLVSVLAHGEGNGAVALSADLTADGRPGRRPDHQRQRRCRPRRTRCGRRDPPGAVGP